LLPHSVHSSLHDTAWFSHQSGFTFLANKTTFCNAYAHIHKNCY